MSHDLALLIAKTFGLIYLMAFFVLAALHTYRPGGRAKADHAARSILTTEDRPCD